MLDSNIAELFKYMILVFGILLIIGTVMILFQMNTISDYQNRVNDTIARYGGLTTAAQTELKTVSTKQYDGIYSIDTHKSDVGAKPYGTAVNYTINVSIKNPLASSDSRYGSQIIHATRSGVATTTVRKPAAN